MTLNEKVKKVIYDTSSEAVEGILSLVDVEVKVLTYDRDIWKQRAESKMAVWRETLEKCVLRLERRVVDCDHAAAPCKRCDDDIAAFSAARELLEVTHD